MDNIARRFSYIFHDPTFKVILPDNYVGEERAVQEKVVVILACILKRRKVISIEIGSAAEASETNSSLVEALEMLRADWSSPADNNPIIEFQRIIRNLSSNHLDFLDSWLQTEFYFKKNTATGLMAPVESVKGSFESVKGLGAGDGGFVMKSAFPAMVGVFVKTVADGLISDVVRQDSIPWAKPYMDASAAGGILLIGSAIVLMEKKPWPSKIMVKFGAMAIAFSTLLPMALALPPVTALVFGLLMAFILVATAALV